MLTAAKIDSGTLNPVFGTNLLCQFFQTFMAELPLIVNRDILRALDGSHLPVTCPHLAVDDIHNHTDVLCRWSRQREYGFDITIDLVEYQISLDQALNAIELQVIAPLLAVYLIWMIPL